MVPRDSTYPVDRSSTAVRRMRLGALRVTNARFPALTSARHAHEQSMCTFTLAGQWTQTRAGTMLECRTGSLLTKEGGEAHVDRFEPPGIHVLMVEVDTSAAKHLRSCFATLLDGRCLPSGSLTPLAHRVVTEMSVPSDVTPLVVEGLLFELLGSAARVHASRPSQGVPTWLRRARELLLDSVDRPPSISEIARAVDIHPLRLARAFRTFFASSPGAFVRRARLDRAAHELIDTDRSLAEIATWAGFADQSHFTHAFKRHTGVAPGRYRLAARSSAAPRSDT